MGISARRIEGSTNANQGIIEEESRAAGEDTPSRPDQIDINISEEETGPGQVRERKI